MYWDSKNQRVVQIPPEPIKEHPGWEWHDCHCCNGIQWGGEHAVECKDCAGQGRVAVHLESGVMAIYPGGPFLGSAPDLRRAA
jgi:hypothetical protein